MANYTKLSTGEVFTECQLYACLISKCCYQCNAGWNFERDSDAVIHTGQVWMEYWRQNGAPQCNCLNGDCEREVAYFNLITEANIGGNGSDRVTVTLLSAEYINNEDLVPPTPVYTVDWGDGSPTEIIALPGFLQHNVAALPDNIYYGTITWEGASFEFWYNVVGGLISDNQSGRTTRFTYDLSCASYPNYAFEMQDIGSVDAFAIENVKLFIFGDVVSNTSIGGASSYDETGDTTSDLAGVSDAIVAQYEAGVPVSPIENIGIFRTQCIE